MPDKYQALREGVPDLIAEAARQGGINTRAQLILDLLAERDALRSALQAAVDCGIVPKSSASDGGANRYSEQVLVADQVRAALAQ